MGFYVVQKKQSKRKAGERAPKKRTTLGGVYTKKRKHKTIPVAKGRGRKKIGSR